MLERPPPGVCNTADLKGSWTAAQRDESLTSARSAGLGCDAICCLLKIHLSSIHRCSHQVPGWFWHLASRRHLTSRSTICLDVWELVSRRATHGSESSPELLPLPPPPSSHPTPLRSPVTGHSDFHSSGIQPPMIFQDFGRMQPLFTGIQHT